MNFNNKIILVTGAGGGVGRELVIQLIEKGAIVAAIDISKDGLDQTRAKLGKNINKISTHILNITDKKGVHSLSEELKSYYKQIDGVINNAGIIQPFTALSDLNENTIEKLMNINFYGMMNMVRAFIPHLVERPEAFIANVSSMGGFLPVPGQSVYGASKAAVKIATEGLRMELSKTNISVSSIIPGGIETDIKKNSGLEDEENNEEKKKSAGIKLTSPQNAAKIIIRGIEKKKARILIGTDAKLMDFLYRLMPIKAGEIISKVMSQNHGNIFYSLNKVEEQSYYKAS